MCNFKRGSLLFKEPFFYALEKNLLNSFTVLFLKTYGNDTCISFEKSFFLKRLLSVIGGP